MMKSSFFIRLIVGFITAFVFLVAWLKVPTPTLENTTFVTGQLEYVSAPCCEDVGIRLKGDNHFYYINRGVESGIDVDAWSRRMGNDEVSLRIIETRWSPLNPAKRTVPVAEISHDGEVLFSSMVY